MTQAFNLSQFANKVNTSGQADLTTAVTGALPVANGGTGVTATPANGELLIGNGSGFTKTTLTAGSGITVTNGAGSISIASSGGAGGLGGLQAFTSNGTFTIPAGVTKLKMTITGGGGGGSAGASGGCYSYMGGAGASGATAIKFLSGVTAGNTLSVTVGGGGSATGNSTAGTGGTSSVASGTQTITTVSASGGAGGPNGQGGGGVFASPGTASNGDINITGNPPPTLSNLDNCAYGGAASFWGGAGKSANTQTNSGRTAGTLGGGGAPGYGSGAVGSSGGAGIVIFEW